MDFPSVPAVMYRKGQFSFRYGGCMVMFFYAEHTMSTLTLTVKQNRVLLERVPDVSAVINLSRKDSCGSRLGAFTCKGAV